MYSYSVCALVRDVKTGKVIAKAPEEELWLIREKSGYGRAARTPWNGMLTSSSLSWFPPKDTRMLLDSDDLHIAFALRILILTGHSD